MLLSRALVHGDNTFPLLHSPMLTTLAAQTVTYCYRVLQEVVTSNGKH